MAKPRSGFKRRPYQPPEGVTIPIRTQHAYDMLSVIAKGNGTTIGRWAEGALDYALSGEPYLPPVKRPASPTMLKRPRSLKISERLFDRISQTMGEGNEMIWIGATLLALGCIELERMRGAREQPDRFG